MFKGYEMAFRIFIASSSESIELLNLALTELPRAWENAARKSKISSDPLLEAVAWNDRRVFPAGTTVLDVLLGLPRAFDAAIFLFGADDERVRRGAGERVPRDNVIFELGLFMAELGPERCLVLKEDSVNAPSDLAGLVCDSFSANRGESTDAQTRTRILETVIRPQFAGVLSEACDRWMELGYAPTRLGQELVDAGTSLRGIADALNEQALAHSHALTTLAQYAFRREPVELQPEVPFLFDASSCVTAYLSGLTAVRERLWATTWFHSRFWMGNSMEVLNQNQDLAVRLMEEGREKPRRLFLLARDINEEVEALEQELISYRQHHQYEDYERLKSELELFHRRVTGLVNHGFDVRVGPCPAEVWLGLPSEMRELSDRPSIVIYDHDRVDLQEAGRDGRIYLCAVFTGAMASFDAVIRSAEGVFEDLWRNATIVDEFVDKLKGVEWRVRNRIDYQPHWLAMYEFNLNEEDSALKVVEQNAIKQAIRLADMEKKIEAWLDIGTGTGSLPLKLTSVVADDGVIVAIDRDDDCVRFAQAIKRAGDARGDDRIKIVRADFLATFEADRKFDLVTCGLGTISHFGADRDDAKDQDGIDRALSKMADILDDEGMILLSTWSDAAVAKERLLDVYRPGDAKRLADWSPKEQEMRDRLKRHRLRFDEQTIHDRLLLWQIRR